MRRHKPARPRGEVTWRDPAFYGFAMVGVMLLCLGLLCSTHARSLHSGAPFRMVQPDLSQPLPLDPIAPSDYRHAPEPPPVLTF